MAHGLPTIVAVAGRGIDTWTQAVWHMQEDYLRVVVVGWRGRVQRCAMSHGALQGVGAGTATLWRVRTVSRGGQGWRHVLSSFFAVLLLPCRPYLVGDIRQGEGCGQDCTIRRGKEQAKEGNKANNAADGIS